MYKQHPDEESQKLFASYPDHLTYLPFSLAFSGYRLIRNECLLKYELVIGFGVHILDSIQHRKVEIGQYEPISTL